MEKQEKKYATGIRGNDVLDLIWWLKAAYQDLEAEKLEIPHADVIRKMLNALYGRKARPNKKNRRK